MNAAGHLATDGPARLFSGDLRQKLTITNLLSLTVEAFDRIDILVNASRQVSCCLIHSTRGYLGRGSPRTELDDGAATQSGDGQTDDPPGRNLGIDEGQVGSIVNISSIAARRTRPDLLAYSVSAAASTR